MGFIVNLCKDLKGFGHVVDMNDLANIVAEEYICILMTQKYKNC